MAERKSMLQKGEYREPLSPISLSQAASRTPMRKKTTNLTAKTPTAKTPSAKTPGKKGSSLGGSSTSDYDRYIPNRALMNNKVAIFKILHQNLSQNSNWFWNLVETFCRIW